MNHPAPEDPSAASRADAAGGAVVELRVGAPAHGGHFVARHEGRVVFMRHSLPGELVRARLRADDASARFWRADAVEVLEASPDRRPHPWAEADALRAAERGTLPVGGAEFGHIGLSRQRALKGEVFAEQLHRLGGMDADAVGFAGVEAVDGEHPLGLGWRTRAAFSVDAAGRLAMNAHHSDVLVPVKDMPLATDAIRSLKPWDVPLPGIARVEIAAPAAGGGVLVLLIAAPDAPAGSAERAARRLPDGVSVAAATQAAGSAADGKGSLRRLAGRTWVAEEAAGHAYRVTGEGFWQIHRRAPDVLVEAVTGLIAPSPGDAVADLYAGAGLFTLPLAAAVGPEGLVYSIEGAPGTSRDARRNAHELPQARVRQGRVERLLRPAAAEAGRDGKRFSGVVLDPPRTGAGKAVVRQIAEAAPARIAYVSCDPASFARDVADFARRGYRLASVRVLDLYPNTHHLETVGLLVPSGPGPASHNG
ncbi:class I SAM-dependent RNA methyltransferase [Zafaria sp. Z1313]|uniref:class I SAM-dependent RNA methyltransferase n=1 Tax=Zafaria sp. Z1313 TaxID=3423202 RepID=UPI003D30269E